MSIWTALKSLLSPSSLDPGVEASRLAALLLAELKLYNEKALESSRRSGVLDPALVPELARAYEMFVSRSGVAEETLRIFREQAKESLFPTQPDILAPVLAELQSQLPPSNRPR